MRILVSACLMGIACRYDGKSNDTLASTRGVELIPFCPEVYGGMSTPRAPSEIRNGRVIDNTGADVTAHFLRGAEAAVAFCRANGITAAILQERSPSCGSGTVHNGLFDGGLIAGDGIAASRLKEAGITVIPSGNAKAYLEALTARSDETQI